MKNLFCTRAQGVSAAASAGETGQAADGMVSAKHSFGDRLSKQAKWVHEGERKNRSNAIHGIKDASCGKRIPWVRVRTFSALGGFRGADRAEGDFLDF